MSISLDQQLHGTSRLRTPVWVFDPHQFCVRWANAAALELWRAPSLDELLRRDFSDSTAASRARTVEFIATFTEDETAFFAEDWTFYPHGEPVSMRCFISAIRMDNGLLAMLCEAHVRNQVDPRGLRSLEALRHVSAITALVSLTGEVLVMNDAAHVCFASGCPFDAWFVDPTAATRLLAAVAQFEVFSEDLYVHTTAGPRCHAVEARRAHDPVTGQPAVAIHQVDVTQQRAREAMITDQRREILELSAPLLHVGHDVIAVPIIAAVTPERIRELSPRLLRAISDRRAAVVIFDLTGATAPDHHGATHLLKLFTAIKLLGAKVLVTGVRPELARTFAQQDTALTNIPVLRSLEDALASVHSRRAR